MGVTLGVTSGVTLGVRAPLQGDIIGNPDAGAPVVTRLARPAPPLHPATRPLHGDAELVGELLVSQPYFAHDMAPGDITRA